MRLNDSETIRARGIIVKNPVQVVKFSSSTEPIAHCILVFVSWEWDGPGSTFAHGASPVPRTLKLIYEC